jgi:hypothetical protein
MEKECCPKFDPAPWQDATLTWDHKRFVKDRVRSFLHIPLNFGAVMTRNMTAIEAHQAKPELPIILSDENSLWGADVYLEVTKEIPGAQMATLSGTFLTRVYEGPYKDIGKWVKDFRAFVGERGHEMKKLYFYYTTCPKCAKKWGKNHVVLLAQI